MDGSRQSLIRMSSELTRDESDEFADQLPSTSSEGSPATESMSTEWTDEKHSLYLKSMETSFVNQLYDSLNSPDWHSEKELSGRNSSGQAHYDTRTPSGQFKVLQGGCWKKIDFERPELRPNKIDHDLVGSPWIQHFRSGSRLHVLASPSLLESARTKNLTMNLYGKQPIFCGSASSSKGFHARRSPSCQRDLIDSNAEVSDQNFVDEEKDVKASSGCSSKKIKFLVIDAARDDQVVP